MAKAKLIRSSESPSGQTGEWHSYDRIKPFIQGIETGKIEMTQVSGALISGIPTPWARAKLFWFAFDYIQHLDPNIKESGLIDFYRLLVSEWKGLMALIALFPNRVSFSAPVDMNQDGPFDSISSSLGRMLMEESDLWTNLQLRNTKPAPGPFIQLIKYYDKVIGGTSPFTLVFTGIDYSKLQRINDISWYRGGRFEDPVKYLQPHQIQQLYLYIGNLNHNFPEFESNLQLQRENNKVDLTGLTNMLWGWQRELETLAREKNVILDENGTIAKYANISMPFKIVFNSEQKVYQKRDGTLTFLKPNDPELKVEIGDLQTLLKDDERILGWHENGNMNNSLSKAAVYLMRVTDPLEKNPDDQIKYFALPLSLYGVRMLNKDLGTLLSQRNSNFSLTGRIDEHRNLVVDLTIPIDGRPQRLNSREYKIEWVTQNNKIIMWPDFISDNWDSYYLYSEFPSNVQGVKYVPFFKQCQRKDDSGTLIDTQSFITVSRQINNSIREDVLFSNSTGEDLLASDLEITKLINYPVGQVTQDAHKYEIFKSNKPVAGLEIRDESTGITEILGYLIVKNPNDDSMGKRGISDLTTENITTRAIVGIDFGSNNSCVHYKTANSDVKPVQFKNRRLALVGIDSDINGIAQRDELLFFSNEKAFNGQVKSWLHEHDWNYVGFNKDMEIAGGVPVNEKNILVKEMDRQTITTQAGILHYNMKWLSDSHGLSKKTAFLKALWLSVCADLYAEKCIPSELRWSFPGSMSSNDYTQYNTIYNVQLPVITPILNPQTNPKTRIKPVSIIDQTEAEAVCKFALSRDYGLNSGNLFLGIDVGGSTSDILVLAQDTSISGRSEAKLFKQSSVRIAAGVFFDAITNSFSFRKAIFDYHQQQKRIRVENIREIQSAGHKAPFYLNNVFDQLTEDDFSLFYTYIGKEASFVFALPAFVTGLLLFYSGKLVSKTIKDNNLASVRDIHLLPYGKGGRLFHWLQTFPGSALCNAYFGSCFREGFGEGAENYSFRYRADIVADNKSEVSKGLAVENILIYDRNIRFESDIFAEQNIRFRKNGEMVEFSEFDVVSNNYFENVRNFEFPEKLVNFEKFLSVFIDFIGHKTGLVRNIATLESRSRELRDLLGSFIENDSEYRKAINDKQQTNRFEYRFPIFIAEGLCYLEKVLIPEIFKS